MELKLRVCLVVVILALVGKINGEENKQEFVISLDNSNFTEIVSKHDFILVEFYAPWCGHCKKLAPEFEKAAKALSKHDPPITLAKVDASDDTNKDLASEYDVKGFPSIKILRKGASIVQEYKGPRDADGIVQYVKKQLGPASVEIKSSQDASDVVDLNRIFIVGVFPRFSGEEYENFMKLAELLRSEYDFGHTLDAKFLPRGEPSVSGPVIRLLKPFDELFAESKDFNLEAAKKFIESEDDPSVVTFDMSPNNQAYLSKFFGQNDNTKVSLILNFSSANAEALKTKFGDIAYLFKGGNLSFLIGDLEPSKPLLQYFKLQESQAPLIYIQSNDKKYLKTNLEADQLVHWFKKYLDGKVEPYIVSQPIPEVNDEPVKVVVLNSLQDMVFNSGKQVFLEFYAPWCGHCKSLAPILDDVAVSYEKDPNVLIAKFDATANDVPSEKFDVQGFPTMFFISSKGKIVEYDGDRTKEEISAFIEQHRDDKQNHEKNTSQQPQERTSGSLENQPDEAASSKDEL